MRKETKKALKEYENSLTEEQRRNLVREAKSILRKFDTGRTQIFWGFVLLGLGIYYLYSSIGAGKLSDFAEGALLGEGAVFLLWSLRELFGGLMKR